MSSRKLQALDFIKRYFLEWGHSPTRGEIAAELGVSTKRAHDLVDRLANDQMVERETGKTRGIRLVDRSEELTEADVLLRLSALGWTIGQGSRVIPPPTNPADAAIGAAIVQGLMEKGLHALPLLDHVPDDTTGAGINENTRQGRKPGARTAAPARGAPGGKPRGLGQAAP